MIFCSSVDINVKPSLIKEFFPYRKGPRMKTIAATVRLDSYDVKKLYQEFEKHPKYKFENHVAWIQDNDLLYVYSNGRLLVGVADITVNMWVE
jgi:hypothetical protein